MREAETVTFSTFWASWSCAFAPADIAANMAAAEPPSMSFLQRLSMDPP